ASLPINNFSYKLRGFRRCGTGGFSAEQFFAQASQCCEIVNVVACRQQFYRQADFFCARLCLLEHLLRTPIDTFKHLAMRLFEADQIVAAIICRTENNVLAGRSQHLHSMGESRGWNGRAIRIDQTNATETTLKQIFGRKPKAFAKTSSALREQIEVGRQYVCISPFPTDRSINCNAACFSQQSSTHNC